jgi:hypothetical protein
MAFRKTSIALQTRVLPDEEARAALSQLPGDYPPPHPALGDVWEGMIWDGGAWVTQDVWDKTRAQR